MSSHGSGHTKPEQTGSEGMLAPLARAKGEEVGLARRRGRPRKQTQEPAFRVQFVISEHLFQLFEEVKRGLGSGSQADALSQMSRFADWYLQQQDRGYVLLAREVSGQEKKGPPATEEADLEGARRLQMQLQATTQKVFSRVRRRLGYRDPARTLADLVRFMQWFLAVRDAGGHLVLTPPGGAPTEGREVVVVVL